MPMRRQTSNDFFLGTVRRRNSSPFIARRNQVQPSAVDGITRLIGEAQKSISVIQQITPLLDQFRQLSPIISNLPMLIKLMSSLNETPTTETNTFRETEVVEEESRNTMTVEERTNFVKKEVERILKEIGIDD